MIEVKIDKRTELLGVLLRLSNYDKTYPRLMLKLNNYPYLQEMYQYFAPYKGHNAVKLIDELVEKLSFNYDAPVVLMLHCDEDLNFYGQNEYPFAKRLKKSELVLKFLDQVKDFALISNFDKFYEDHKDFYTQEIEDFKNGLSIDEVEAWMKKFFKRDFKDKNFIVNLLELFTTGGYGYWVGNDCYCNDSKRYDKDGNAEKWGLWNTPRAQSHYLHEFCHSVINPLTELNQKEIKDPSFTEEETIKLQKAAYGTISTKVNESIIRAIQLCYIREHNQDPEMFLQGNERIGFNRKVLLSLAEKMVKYRVGNNKQFEEIVVELANTINEVNSTISENRKELL